MIEGRKKHIFSPETKANLGSKTKELWKDPEYRKHMSEVHKGRVHSGSFKKGHTLRNTGRTRFKKGTDGIWSTREMSEEHKAKLLAANHAKKGKKVLTTRNEKNCRWKGIKASYSSIHQWIKRRFGKANRCENPDCYYPRQGSKGLMLAPKVFDWANKSGKYLHDKDDWMMLCRSCHMTHDRKNNVSVPHNWETRVLNEKVNDSGSK